MAKKTYPNTFKVDQFLSSISSLAAELCQHSGEGITILKSHQLITNMPIVIISHTFISEFCVSVIINKFLLKISVHFTLGLIAFLYILPTIDSINNN